MLDRECIILCNFNDKELKMIKVYANMVGLKDQIIVSWKNSNVTIKDIIEGNLENVSDVENGIKDRAIIFNSKNNNKVSVFIDNMRKMRVAPSMKAVVTETSINWTLGELLQNLVEERRAERQGKIVKH